MQSMISTSNKKLVLAFQERGCNRWLDLKIVVSRGKIYGNGLLSHGRGRGKIHSKMAGDVETWVSCETKVCDHGVGSS